MINFERTPDFVKTREAIAESCVSLYIPPIAESVLIQKFMDRFAQHQTDPAQLMQQVSQILSANNAPEIFLPKVATALGVAFQGEGCWVVPIANGRTRVQTAIWKANGQGKSTANLTGTGDSVPEIPPSLLSLNHPIFKRLLAGKEVVAVSDTQAGEVIDGTGFEIESLPFRSLLATATYWGEAVNGLIIVGKSEPYRWSSAERYQLKAVSDLVAIAISYGDKTQQVVELQQQVQRQTQYQTLLSWIASIIDTPLELNQILQLAIEGTTDTLKLDRGSVVLLKYADPLFKTRAPHTIPKAKATLVCEWPLPQQSESGEEGPRRGRTENRENAKTPVLTAPSFWLSESALYQKAFMRAPKPLAIADTTYEVDLPENSRDVSMGPDTRSLLFIPLVGTTAQGTILGFLMLQHSSPRLWQPEELEVVELVAAQLSTAIIQTQTLQQVQALVEDRTAQLQRSLDVQAKLYEQTRKQVEQLRRLNQLKDEFVDTVSHELRTPLTTMKVAIELLRQPDLQPTKRAIYLDKLEQQCLQEKNLIDDLLKLRQLESQQEPMVSQEINLKSLMQSLTADFLEKWNHKGLTLGMALPRRSLRLQTDPSALERILVELLTNAGKYSAPSTEVKVEVALLSDRVVLKITNLGRGILPEELPHIFEKFRRGTGATQQAIPGTGLGLALVKSLVQHLKGTITAVSSLSENPKNPDLWTTCFTLTLPSQQSQDNKLKE